MTELSKPEISIPSGEAPTTLSIEDLTLGTGEEATVGSQVSVHYVGAAWSDGQEFDASWDRGEHFEFRLGRGDVIAGWDQGVVGMRPGGRRRLTIPAALGYGSSGAGGVIRPNETLVFVVDLITIT